MSCTGLLARVLAAAVLGGALAAAGGCATLAPHPPVARKPPPVPISPFAEAPVTFLIHGSFARGEQVLVRVCVNADHSIASTAVLESSGDPYFDERAVNWARRVRLRPAQTGGPPLAHCGAVRVELQEATEPLDIGGPQSVVG